MTAAGCQYRQHEGESTCNKICDPGQTLCPFHLLLTTHELQEAKSPQSFKTPRGYTE
jgi:hypothetical protein